ncbi:hypothetical protein SAMN05421780_101544 [Flexibacter flexilis DSM 6793]|uniref:Uncharacterized protein n=1 Tax=Flexibacter flexilis DSM 6793 TaxID=927664 RepID=A0A1I1E0N4_9BACT|nr:hypothetical protein [Flexibacter flexilis]SFB80222.1 hypothetical protein SAMN05421780_101544 [Flexibacter flexilis DSM 6793]
MALNTKKPKSILPSDIEDWQSKDKQRRKIGVVKFESEFSESGYVEFFIHAPTKEQVNAIAEIAAERKAGWVTKIQELAINSCVLAGDLDIAEQDDSVYFALNEQCQLLFETKKKL